MLFASNKMIDLMFETYPVEYWWAWICQRHGDVLRGPYYAIVSALDILVISFWIILTHINGMNTESYRYINKAFSEKVLVQAGDIIKTSVAHIEVWKWDLRYTRTWQVTSDS